MKQYFYPAIFHTAEEGGFRVSFPDIPECLTEGGSMEDAYQKKHNSRAVKKTLSIPEWLNEEAMSMGVYFSQVLQEALISKIQAH